MTVILAALVIAVAFMPGAGALETGNTHNKFSIGINNAGSNQGGIQFKRFLDGDATTATAGWVSGDRCSYGGAYAFLENDGVLIGRVTVARINYAQIDDKYMSEGVRYYNGTVAPPGSPHELNDCPAPEFSYPTHKGSFPAAPVITLHGPSETFDTQSIASPTGAAMPLRWDWVSTTAHTIALVVYQDTLGDNVQIPLVALYFDALDPSLTFTTNAPAPPPPPPAGGGLFTVSCPLDHMASDDPIVYPGQPGAAHLHQFFGAKNVTASTVASSLPGSPTTCANLADSAGYWTPALEGPSPSNAVVNPDSFTAYYLAPEGHTVAPIPAGLVMISDAASAPLVSGWSCFNNVTATTPLPQSCSATQTNGFLKETIHFPMFWDGVNLDSANHRSHLSFIQDAGHPVEIAHLVIQVSYTLFYGATYHLAPNLDQTIPAAHADFMNGWNQAALASMTNVCLNGGLDCKGVVPAVINPTAAVSVTPSSGTAPLAVTADASASVAGSSPISTYTFNFGDGTTVGPQAGATAAHTYTTANIYTVTVTVLDTDGGSAQATAGVTVNPAIPQYVLPAGGPTRVDCLAGGTAKVPIVNQQTPTFLVTCPGAGSNNGNAQIRLADGQWQLVCPLGVLPTYIQTSPLKVTCP
jgi:hypothetical protein